MCNQQPNADDSKPGPEPERLKIEGDWEDAVAKAIRKPKPPDGWPDPEESDPEHGTDLDSNG